MPPNPTTRPSFDLEALGAFRINELVLVRLSSVEKVFVEATRVTMMLANTPKLDPH